MSKKIDHCNNWKTYKGVRAPKCNGGNPCRACTEKWKAAQAERERAAKPPTKKDRIDELLSKAQAAREVNRHWIQKTKNAIVEGDVETVDRVKKLLIADLQRVYAIDKDAIGQSSGRDTYRRYGRYSEQIVKLVFGQWVQFQRKAGLADTLHEKTVLRHLTATDRAQDVARYAERFVKPWDGAYQAVDVTQEMLVALTCSDLHSKFCDPFARRVWFEVLGIVQPDITDINGDLCDYPKISRHRQLPGAFTMGIGAETKWGADFLEECRHTAQDSSITFRLGNHDIRMVYALADGLAQLADLEHLEYNRLFRLDENEIGLCARSTFLNPTAHMKRNDVAQNWSTLYGPDGRPLYTWVHGFLHGKNAISATMRKFMTSGTSGHLHAAVSATEGSMATGVLRWDQTGCMAHPRAAAAGYVPGPVEALGWGSSFLLTRIFPKSGHIQTEQIMIGEDMAYYDGYIFEVTDDERAARAEMLEV